MPSPPSSMRWRWRAVSASTGRPDWSANSATSRAPDTTHSKPVRKPSTQGRWRWGCRWTGSSDADSLRTQVWGFAGSGGWRSIGVLWGARPARTDMEDVSLAHAKDHLEELIERAAKGEDIRISDSRLGTVRLQPVKAAAGEDRRERRAGRWKGRFTVPERLFEPLSEEELAWLSGERSK